MPWGPMSLFAFDEAETLGSLERMADRAPSTAAMLLEAFIDTVQAQLDQQAVSSSEAGELLRRARAALARAAAASSA